MRDIPQTRPQPLPLRVSKKCLTILVLGAIMGGMLLAGLCKRRKREA